MPISSRVSLTNGANRRGLKPNSQSIAYLQDPVGPAEFVFQSGKHCRIDISDNARFHALLVHHCNNSSIRDADDERFVIDQY